MRRFSCVTLILALLVSAVFFIQFFNLGSANPSSMIPPPPPLNRIYIRADGGVDPPNAPIKCVGNVYTLKASLTDYVIEIQCDNVVVDGAGFSLIGKPHENGVVLTGRRNVVVKNFDVKRFSAGIYVSNCLDCTIDKNTVMNSSRGISLVGQSKNNVFRSNLLMDNILGIYISHSWSNQFRSNLMQGNKYNLNVDVGNGVDSTTVLSTELANDIDFSNLVDDKPICYWVNKENMVVPSDCGFVALIGCRGITVQNLKLSKNGFGVLLFGTVDSTISQNNITDNVYGIWAERTSAHIAIRGNYISDCADDGVSLVGSSGNSITDNNIVSNSKRGIRLKDLHDCTITGNTIKANFVGGINLQNISDLIIRDNTLADHRNDEGSAIAVGLTSNAAISNNIIENNCVGILIHDLSKNNYLSENTIRNNDLGLHFYYTRMNGPYTYPESSNTFRNNRLDNNKYPLKFESSFVQDIDNSNSVNGKPIYYWVGQRDKTVPSDAGCIGLVNCVGIKVEGVSVSNNLYGLMLFSTNNSLITKCTFSNNEKGVYVRHCSNNVFSDNEANSNAATGFFVEDSFNNTFVQNRLSNNQGDGIQFVDVENSVIARNNVRLNKAAGIKLVGSVNITVLENFISQNNPGLVLSWKTSQCRVISNLIKENNNWGLRIEGSQINSVIHHNNFVNNKVNQTLQVSIPWPANHNEWDDGKEGNYWSDYTARYPNASAQGNIGDTPFFINENNQDNYPLLSPVEIPNLDLSSLSSISSVTPTQNPSATVSESGPNNQPEPFPSALLAAGSGVVVVAVGVAVLLYYKKQGFAK